MPVPVLALAVEKLTVPKGCGIANWHSRRMENPRQLGISIPGVSKNAFHLRCNSVGFKPAGTAKTREGVVMYLSGPGWGVLSLAW